MRLRVLRNLDDGWKEQTVREFVQSHQPKPVSPVLVGFIDELERYVSGPDVYLGHGSLYRMVFTTKLIQFPSDTYKPSWPAVSVSADEDRLYMTYSLLREDKLVPWESDVVYGHYPTPPVRAAISFCIAMNHMLANAAIVGSYFRYTNNREPINRNLKPGLPVFRCPCCKAQIDTTDPKQWQADTHLLCGQKFQHQAPNAAG